MRYARHIWRVAALSLGGIVFYHATTLGGEPYARLFPWNAASKHAPGAEETVAPKRPAALVRAVDGRAAPEPRGHAAFATAMEPADEDAAKDETAEAAPAPEVTEPPETERTVWVRVAGSRVNVRARPSFRARRLTSYRRDTRLQVVGRQGRWLEVREAGTDTTGWMLEKYLVEEPTPREAVLRPGDTRS